MKRVLSIFAVLLALVFIVSITACGTSDEPVQTTKSDTDDTGTESPPSTTLSATEGSQDYYLVGISQLIQHEALDAATEGFKDALTEELGNQVQFDYQNAQGDPNTSASIANGFVASKVDLIMANATPALQAAATATADIPVLGTSITEYGVALGIEDFQGLVGGNVSGTSDLAPLDEQAAIIKDIFPDKESVGLLYCTAEANSLYQINTIKTYLEGFGYRVEVYPFNDSNDLAAITTSAVSEVEVIYVPTDNTVASNIGLIDNICRPAEIPVVTGEKGTCAVCGVATLSIDYYDLGYATGQMAYKVLTGQADISEMPIEYAPNFTKMYNPEICTELGITVSDKYEPIE